MTKYYSIYLCLALLCWARGASAQSTYNDLYQAAIKRFDAQQPKEGYELLNKAIGLKPAAYDALYARAYYRILDQNYRDAREDLNLLLKLYPADTTLYFYRGQTNANLNDYQAAEADYLAAYQRDTTNTEYTNALGSLYYLLDLNKDALLYLNKSLQHQPKDTFALFYRASVYEELRQYDRAEQDLKTLLALDPQNIDAHKLKARIALARAQYPEAIKIYENLLNRKVRLEVDDFWYWGRAYYAQKKYKQALFYLETPEKPEYAPLWWYRGKARYALNRHAEALRALDTAIAQFDDTDPRLALARYDRALVYLKLNRQKESEKDAIEALGLMPDILLGRDNEGQPLMLEGDVFAALGLRSRKALTDTIRLQSRQARAESFLADGDAYRSLAEIDKAIAIDSSLASNYLLRAMIHLDREQYSAAQADLARATTLTRGRNDERQAYLSGLLAQETGKHTEAITQFHKAISLNSKQANYHRNLAQSLAATQQLPEAFATLRQAMLLQPDNREMYLDRAEYYLLDGKPNLAWADCERVIREQPDNIWAYYYRGKTYQAQKRYAEAVADFSRVLALYPDDAEVSHLLQDTLSKWHKK